MLCSVQFVDVTIVECVMIHVTVYVPHHNCKRIKPFLTYSEESKSFFKAAGLFELKLKFSMIDEIISRAEQFEN